MAKRVEALLKEVATAEQFDELMDLSEKQLIILDVYKEWSGPCTVMMPTFERIFLEYDECDRRVVFARVNPKKVPQLEEHAVNQTCKPLFLFYKSKVLLGKVSGANAPEIVSMVADNIPPVPEDE